LADYRQAIVERLWGILRPRHVILAGGRSDVLADILAKAAAASGATLHVAARHPADWLRTLRRTRGDRCVLHEAPPADAIGLIPVPELCWVDADPNWWTSHGILEAIAAKASHLGKPFPVTIIENVGWPYGRRDSYDDPALIPDAGRRPHEHAGLLPGQSAPAGGAGLYAERYNATAENEPANGVLTAIEDFLDGRTDTLRLVVLPGFGGLAAIYPRIGHAAEAFGAPAIAAYALAIAACLETVRLDQAVALQEQQAAMRRVGSRAPKSPAGAGAAIRTRLSSGVAASRARMPDWLRTQARLVRRVVRGHSHTGDAAPSAEDADAARLRASKVFDAAWYLNAYHDVADSGDDPVLHYLRNGAAEQRDPGPYFSTSYYLATYPDVAEAGVNPLLHYLVSGAAEGRDPGPSFNTSLYLEENPDICKSGMNPLEHFLAQDRAGERQVDA